MSVYPRTYGEHSTKLSEVAEAAGLSPYLRGTRPLTMCLPHKVAVYPRTYGEHDGLNNVWAHIGGLSPYLRGTQTYLKPSHH
ncbi:conserved hypothetical protein [Xenorhabdus nematophila str. Websteri]|nr:conserved hypothetical protein [Xenorhabdus nematophila str. Websteri]